MKHIASTSYDGYSIITAVLMVGFLLILTTSTLNLVLQEMQDGRGRQGYLKAYAGAEGSLELALLDIKVEGYGYDDDSFVDNEMLGNGSRNPTIGYEFNSRVNSHSGTLQGQGIDIIPLFATGAAGIESMTDIDFDVTSGDIVWNIITQDSGVSGIGAFNQSTDVGVKSIDVDGNFIFNDFTPVSSILSGEDYLILQNLSNTPATYTLSGTDGFTLPRAEVFSSARVGKYKQNLKTIVDNTEFLGILRYSVYSGD